MRLTDTTWGEGGWPGSDGQPPEVLKDLDRAGLAALEVVSPRSFELHAAGRVPSPWERLRQARSAVSATPLIALVAGQGLVGRASLADDAVELFVTTLAALGIDRFRVYDPLNDLRNLRFLVETIRCLGKPVEGALCYAVSPTHAAALWVEQARQLAELGCESVFLRDSGCLLTPPAAAELVPRLLEAAGVPIGVSGWGPGAAEAYRAAAEAGSVAFDVSLLPSRPDLRALGGKGIDLSRAVAGVEGEGEAGLAPTNTLTDEVLVELGRHGAEERLGEVEAELERILPELGYPPPEPPLRRLLATQAVLNVIGGSRYEAVTQEIKEYLHGLWGRPPGPVSAQVRRTVLDRDQALSMRAADLLQPQVPPARARLEKAGIEPSDENVLIVLLFPELGPSFFKGEQSSPGPGPDNGPEMEVNMNSEGSGVGEEEVVEPEAERKVIVSEFDVEVDGEVFRVRVTPAGTMVQASLPAGGGGAAPIPVVAGPGSVLAPMQGLIVKVLVQKGDEVKLGDVVAVLEAMKMQNDIVATVAGKVVDVHIREGEVVSPKQPLVTIR